MVISVYAPYFWRIQNDGGYQRVKQSKFSFYIKFIRLKRANNWFVAFKAWSDRAFIPGSKFPL